MNKRKEEEEKKRNPSGVLNGAKKMSQKHVSLCWRLQGLCVLNSGQRASRTPTISLFVSLTDTIGCRRTSKESARRYGCSTSFVGVV